MDQRLTSWKANTLSLAARHTLVSSVVSALPTYSMQSSMLPVGVCDDIDRKCRKFLWGDVKNSRKTHLVAWEDVCKRKNEGGLGLREARKQNTAFMMKVGWGLIKRQDALWVQFLREKYKCGNDVIPRIEQRRGASHTWKGICKAWDKVNDGLGWTLGDGRRVKFWKDKWLPQIDKLAGHATQFLNEEMEGEVVSSFTTDSGGWNWDLISQFLPNNVIQQIHHAFPTGPTDRDDLPIWRETQDGSFTVRSAYQMICSHGPSSYRSIWKLIWKINAPQRCKTFLWLCARGRLFTNQLRASRGLQQDNYCPICWNSSESILHVLRDCSIADRCWRMVVPTHLIVPFFQRQNVCEWLEWNLSQRFKCNGIEWRDFSAIVCRQLWMNRNAGVFNEKAVGASQVLAQASAIAKWSFMRLSGNNDDSQEKFKWNPPFVGWLKINVDGASNRFSKIGVCAGVARDQNGDMLWGFRCNLGLSNSLNAELWGILWALKHAWSGVGRRIIVETDCLEAVSLISDGWEDEHPEWNLLTEIRAWMEKEWEVRLTWCKREVNLVADLVAKEAFHDAVGFQFFTSVSSSISAALAADVAV